MISSIDTYVYNQFKKTIDVILEDEYIVDNALARLDKETRDNFKRAFTGENPHSKIDVTYQFPQIKEKFDARLVIQMGTGAVVEESIGNVEGTFFYRELGTVKERVVIEQLEEAGRIGVVLQHDVGEIEAVEEIEFAERDNVETKGNVISFEKYGNKLLLGAVITVHYIAIETAPKGEEDPKGVKVGFTSQEQVKITPLSTSMDTARSLDAIIKVVLIIMLETAEEKSEYLLQTHRFEEMQNIVPEPIDRLVFGRPLTLTYTVSHNLDFDYLKDIKEINIYK